jgi:hypothetical protein
MIALALLGGSVFAVVGPSITAAAAPVAVADVAAPAAKKAGPNGYPGYWCRWAGPGNPYIFTQSSYTVWWHRLWYGEYACLSGVGFPGQQRM